MPIKAKDFLQTVFEQGNIRSDEIAAVLGASALSELEFPDDIKDKFNSVYLTRQRAENDPEIITKLGGKSKAQTLSTIDEKIEKILTLLPKEKADEIKGNKSTFERLDLAKDALTEVLKGTQSKVEQDVAKVQEEWSQKYEAIKQQAKKDKENYERDIKNRMLDFALKGKIMSYEFADPFADPKIRPTLTETIISQIKQEQENGNPILLDLDTTGNVTVRQEKDGTVMDIFRNGNEKLTIEKLLQPRIDPFLKKSNGKDEPGKTTPITQPAAQSFDLSKMTLHQQMALAEQQKQKAS